MSIPTILLFIHGVVPVETASDFYFYPWRPTTVSAWTAAVLHASWKHVTNNSIAFAATIALLFAIYHMWGRRRTMWILVVFLIVTTPLTKFISNVMLLRDYFGVVGPATNMKGFSGIASAFVGMLIASVGVYTNDRTRTTAGYWVILGAVYLGLGILAVQYSLQPNRLVASIVALLVGFGLIAHQLRSEFDEPEFETMIQRFRNLDVEFDVILLSIGLTVVFIVGMFPSEITGDGTTTNIVAHFVGLAYGFFITLIFISVFE